MWTQTAISHAVQAAARCGAVNSMDCGTLSQITNYAVTQAFGVNITSSAFTASTAGCGVLVVAHFPFNFTVPFIVTSNITLNATACYPS